jgi:hypothetical protein
MFKEDIPCNTDTNLSEGSKPLFRKMANALINSRHLIILSIMQTCTLLRIDPNAICHKGNKGR